ncbi:Ig-like domain-containing protein [Geomonas oryzae]|uniref:Ig-like domain-containing protein n=1 Tax=Geomonas oryzae TaxID=2364273 RepID=UPI00100BB33A|nr:Ig-like domain-containing protein [Geomonas oryzae]
MLSNGKASTFSALSALLSVAILLIVAPATSLATSVSLAWDPSPDPDLAGYRIYYQANSGAVPFQGTGAVEGNAPVDGRNSTTATISGLDPANSYYFAVTAYNSSGAESVYSNIVSVPETLPPTVNITSPADNDAVSGTVTVTASATDNAGIARVQFLVNGVPVFETAKAPYSFTWDVASLAKGIYELTVRAVDVSGNEALSKAVTVSVYNAAQASVPTPPATVSAPLTIADAQLALQIATSQVAPGSEELLRLDLAPYVNGVSQPNGRIDTGDIVVILSLLTGRI